MKPYYQDDTVTIYHGDVLACLAAMADESAQCVVTSPPYWGLRDYGEAGQLGLEPTPQEYVAKMVEVFREVRRVLRADGVCWLNLGDSYATGAGKVGDCPGGGKQGEAWKGYRGTRGGSEKHARGAMGPMVQPNRMPIPGLKPKDLVGIPWRVAFALQDDGWWLRQDIIWHKPNPMPESVRDRCTKAHEYVFLLTKSARYWWDAGAMEEPSSGLTGGRFGGGGLEVGRLRQDAGRKRPHDNGTRNRRSVWTVATQPYSGAHFATFPPALIAPMILAGCPMGGVVLDPFHGAGTTALVCQQTGRRYVGCELNSDYIDMSLDRLKKPRPTPIPARDDEPLLALMQEENA